MKEEGLIMNNSILLFLRDKNKALKEGPAAIERRQRDRLAEMVAYARANSPYYRELYKNLPKRVEDVRLLPITSKKELMPHFDDWVTDHSVNMKDVRGFVDNPDMIGELYHGKYTVATTSGTTGKHGIFLLDERAVAVNFALSIKARGSWLKFIDILKLIARGGRTAVVAATGGHFLVSSGVSRMRKGSSILGSSFKLFSVHTPMPELVAELNKFKPGMLIGYGSAISMLANEQAAGRLHINPVTVEPAGETLADGERERISKLLGAKVHMVYGSTECPFLTSECEHGWYHINTDWAVLEPVDENYQPVQPGELSHTVLLSNLANKVQPILRYDLGDKVMLRPNPCLCGNPHPAIRVKGRAADVLNFPSEGGKRVSIIPLAFVTLIDSIPGVSQFQIVQTTPTNLRVRLLCNTDSDPNQVWEKVYQNIIYLLKGNNVHNITVERGSESPEKTQGGKLRTVIPL